jgi:hypothetical protein
MSNAPAVFKKIGLSFNSEALQKFEAEQSKPRENKYLDPGLYDVEIEKIERTQRECEDPTWVNARISCKAANGKMVSGFIRIPTVHDYFEKADGTKTMTAFVVFRNLAVALGIPDADEASFRMLNTDLSGKKLKIEVAFPYKSFHLKYEDRAYTIVDHSDKPYPLAAGRTFARREEADLWSSQQKPPLRFAYAEIKKFMAPDVPNTFDTVLVNDEEAGVEAAD